MTGLLAGLLFGAGCYLLMRRELARVVFGLVLIGHAITLLLLCAAAPQPGGAAIVGRGGALPAAPTDPLPQALALTAVVIAFATTILAAAMAGVVYDVDALDSEGSGETEAPR